MDWTGDSRVICRVIILCVNRSTALLLGLIVRNDNSDIAYCYLHACAAAPIDVLQTWSSAIQNGYIIHEGKAVCFISRIFLK